jgi:hypothetical protein
MHREYGQRATTMALPEANSKTAREVRSAFVDGALETALPGNSPYHARLRAAEESGVYRDTMSIVDAVGKRFRNRLDNVALLDLDREHLIVATGLLLAWRQDAIAARDSTPSHENQLPLAAFVGHKLGDWPLAIAMADIRTNSAPERLAAMQKDPRFLRTLYPTSEVLRLPASMAESAWAIDGSNALSRSLMDAVIRNESRYYASAISMVGALGLFQVMPATFDGRPDCWEPSADGRKPTAASYLFDPDRNVRFWSCWVAKEFQPRTRNDIVTMLVQHHAGSGNLREWKKSWKGRALERDLELQIECFRFPATRLFVQRVLADIMIIEASGRFETAADQSGKPKT